MAAALFAAESLRDKALSDALAARKAAAMERGAAAMETEAARKGHAAQVAETQRSLHDTQMELAALQQVAQPTSGVI